MILKDFGFALVDDGTLDTVISVIDLTNAKNHRVYRYRPDITCKYRDEFGILDFEAFVTDVVLRDIENDDFNLWHMRIGTREKQR